MLYGPGAPFDVSVAEFEGRHSLRIHAGRRGQERVVPPGGEEYAFTRDLWARNVEVYVSKEQRSVRVWVDGVEIK